MHRIDRVDPVVRMQATGHFDIYSLERNPVVLRQLVEYNVGLVNQIGPTAYSLLDTMTHPTRWNNREDERPVLGRAEFLVMKTPGIETFWAGTLATNRLVRGGGYRTMAIRVIEDLMQPEAVFGRESILVGNRIEG